MKPGDSIFVRRRSSVPIPTLDILLISVSEYAVVLSILRGHGTDHMPRLPVDMLKIKSTSDVSNVRLNIHTGDSRLPELHTVENHPRHPGNEGTTCMFYDDEGVILPTLYNILAGNGRGKWRLCHDFETVGHLRLKVL